MWAVDKKVEEELDEMPVEAPYHDFVASILEFYDSCLWHVGAEEPEFAMFQEWIDNGNKLQLTFSIDGIHIRPIGQKGRPKKEEVITDGKGSLL